MNVLLLTSAEPKNRYGFSMIEKRFPIGLGYLASVLINAGHTVTIHDRFLLGPDDYPEKDNWDFVGIYSNTPCINDTLTLLDYFSDYTTAVGGPHATLFPDSLTQADYIVQGEGEKIICDLVDGNIDDRIITTKRIKDLDSLPVPAYNLFANDDRYDVDTYFHDGKFFNYNSSRGCPYVCSFCDVKRIWGQQWYAHSSQRVIDDCKMLKEQYDIDGIYFREDNFTVTLSRVREIAHGMGELDLMWCCETRVDSLDETLLTEMSLNNCVGVYIGFESGSQRMLDVYRKMTTVKQMQDVCDWCFKLGIKIQASFIEANPIESPEDIRETQKFVEKNQHSFARVCYNTYREFSEYEKFLKK